MGGRVFNGRRAKVRRSSGRANHRTGENPSLILKVWKQVQILKSLYLKIDDKREKIEDFIADNVLKRWDELKNIDDLRKAGSLAVINAVSAYAMTYGLPALTDDVKEQIANANVKVLKRLNRKLQKQLKKKSKGYINRHGGESV